MEAAKALNPDTPSKTTVKLGHDHSLWEAASTEDYWLVHSLIIRNWWMTLKNSLVMLLFMLQKVVVFFDLFICFVSFCFKYTRL